MEHCKQSVKVLLTWNTNRYHFRPHHINSISLYSGIWQYDRGKHLQKALRPQYIHALTHICVCLMQGTLTTLRTRNHSTCKALYAILFTLTWHQHMDRTPHHRRAN
jgi:hypothetical protein